MRNVRKGKTGRLLKSKKFDEDTKKVNDTGRTKSEVEQELCDYIIARLSHLTLSEKFVKNLLEHYKDPDRIIRIINRNAYILTEVKGVGFKKADVLALQNGIRPTDIRRIGAFIEYYLGEQSVYGKSYVAYVELRDAIVKEIGNISIDLFNDTVEYLLDDEVIMISQDGGYVALTSMYELEKNICKELVRLNSYKKKVDKKERFRVAYVIKGCEEEQGFKFTTEQRQAIMDSSYHSVIAITGGAGCVDCDTEFFSQHGWKKISEYTLGDKVIQYTQNGTAELIEPLRYIKQPQETLYHLHSERLNMCLSGDHTFIYLNSEGVLTKETFSKVLESYSNETHTLNLQGKVITGKVLETTPEGVNFQQECVTLNGNLTIEDYPTTDGFEYCFTVPSNMLVLRREGNTFVTGNCGKTTTANGIFRIFDRDKILACALSGKASVRITEATGLNARTIHKTLGYDGKHFEFNDENQFECDCVLIDESTMVNGSLFLSMLKAIPTGATLIMCGDIKQLTPIGNCQVFYDILKHGKVQIIELTKPHRQALKSGIITTSLDISNQVQILSQTDKGTKIFGELQDMVIKIQDTRDTIFNEIIESFKYEWEKNQDILEIQVILAVKNRGIVSCYNVNTEIQSIVNPILDEDEPCMRVFSHKAEAEKNSMYYKIHVGDKVINTKNNYNTCNVDGEKTPLFNGNIGIVTKVDLDSCIVDFISIGEVVITKDNWSNLELAYALTCHKTQGSGFDTVVVGLDSNSYIMNCSEWLYTAITRAKKKCVLISTTNTINNTICQKEVKKKQTFLGDFLENSEE